MKSAAAPGESNPEPGGSAGPPFPFFFPAAANRRSRTHRTAPRISSGGWSSTRPKNSGGDGGGGVEEEVFWSDQRGAGKCSRRPFKCMCICVGQRFREGRPISTEMTLVFPKRYSLQMGVDRDSNLLFDRKIICRIPCLCE